MILLDKGRLLVDFDKDAENIIKTIRDVDGVMLTEAERLYVNHIVSGLKGIGLWTKIKALYGFVGGTAATHRWNWKDMRDVDNAFRIVWTGTLIHNNLGIKGDGLTGEGNTFLNPNAVGLDSKITLGATSNEGDQQFLVGAGSGPTGICALFQGTCQYDANGASIRNYTLGIHAKSNFFSYNILNNPYVNFDGITNYTSTTTGTPTGIGNTTFGILRRRGAEQWSNARITSCIIAEVTTQIELNNISHIMNTAQGILRRK